MGTAETPAEPIRGLIFSFKNRFITFTVSIPPTVQTAKSARPRPKMNRGFQLRNLSACMVAPTEMPRNMVTIFMRAP